MAGGTIDLDETATPEILDPRQVPGLHITSRRPLEPHGGFCRTAGEAQAPQLPRGLTPGMIRAGADVPRSYDLAGDLASDVAAWVLRRDAGSPTPSSVIN
jgi:hypothetical protein